MGMYFFYRIDRVVQLLEAGLDVNSWDSQGSKNTPLHWAACYGNKEIIACLLGNIQIIRHDGWLNDALLY